MLYITNEKLRGDGDEEKKLRSPERNNAQTGITIRLNKVKQY